MNTTSNRAVRRPPAFCTAALLLTILALATTPLAVSKYAATGVGSAQARLAKWAPSGTVTETFQLNGTNMSNNQVILFRDYRSSTRLTYVSNAVSQIMEGKVKFNNATTEVATRYTLIRPEKLVPFYAFLQTTSGYSWPSVVVDPLSDSEQTYKAQWRHWYANDEKIDMTKGTNGLVWSQNFDGLANGTGDIYNAFSPLNLDIVTSTGNGSVHNAQISNTDAENILMNTKWFKWGRNNSGAGENEAWMLLFNRPTGIGDNWAVELDVCIGYQGHTGGKIGTMFNFVIWDTSTSDRTGVNWYSLGIARRCYNGMETGFDNNAGPAGEGVFCTYHTNGVTTWCWPANTTTLKPNGRFGTGDFAERDIFHMRVERSGKRVAMYINGEQALHYSNVVTANDYKIGFRACRAWYGIDNIKIYALKPQVNDNAANNEIIQPAASGMYREVNVHAVQKD